MRPLPRLSASYISAVTPRLSAAPSWSKALLGSALPPEWQASIKTSNFCVRIALSAAVNCSLLNALAWGLVGSVSKGSK